MDYRPSPREEEHRRRQWEEYDREIAFYNERRSLEGRGRSRSPGVDDVGRKRRRSVSPWDRSRYERPRYGDDKDFSRGRDDYGHRKGGYPPYNGRDGRGGGRQPPNPYELDHPAQLKQFAEWFRYTYPDDASEEDRLDRLESDTLREAGSEVKPRDGIRLRWEKYKKEFVTQQVALMFDYHKKSPWFAERYDPSEPYVSLRKRVRKQGWRGKANQFLLELEDGKYDPQIDPPDDVPVSSEEGPPKTTKEHKAENKTEDVKNGTQDEEMNFGIDVEEEQDHEGKTASKLSSEVKSGFRNDEISVMPEGNEILIRTIPPDIGRLKLEEACSSTPGFVHLALGDPSPRKHFYRAGWIKFQDGADMEKAVQELSDKKVDGFKLHVTHTTRPYNTRLRVAPELANRPERVFKDLAQIKQLASVLEEEASILRSYKPDHTPPQSAVETEAKGELVSPSIEARSDTHDRIEIEPELTDSPSEAIDRRVEKLVNEIHDRDPDGGIGREAKKAIITLDLYRAYLRSAYNTCYYCAITTDHVEELQRRCAKHVRKSLSPKMLEEIVASRRRDETMGESSPTVAENDVSKEQPQEKPEEKPREKGFEMRDWKRNDERWPEWVDSKIALLLRKDDLDPRDVGGKHYDEELSRACETQIKQEDEGKYRCKQCNKLFKAVGYVEKHIANKHGEVIKHLDEIPYFNNFALDPHRMQPAGHMPPPPGNGIGPPPQAFGLKSANWPIAPEYGMGHGRPPYANHHGGHGPHVGYGMPPPYYDAWGGYGGPAPAYPGSYPVHHEGMGPPSMGGRRLSDRLGGFIEPMMDLPIKPMSEGMRRAPPPDAKEDPRASGGRKISYHDIDKAAAGDDVNIELSY